MSISNVHGQLLEITVIGCNKLKNTEWISKQDPYVCLEYGNTKYRTRTCTDGGKDPIFQEKFVFPLIEGLRELNVVAWNSNTLSQDDFIGNGRVQLQKALSHGYDDTCWPIQTRSGRYGGEVRLIMHYANAGASKPAKASAPSAPHYAPHPPPVSAPYGVANTAYPPQYPPQTYYPQSTYPPSAYPPPPAGYPSPHHSTYPPPPPTTTYPPSTYPPPPQPSSHYPPGPFPGLYPPAPY